MYSTCVQLTCVGCAAGISPLVRVSTIKSPPHESDMRNIHISPGPSPCAQREIPTIVICNQPQYWESCDKTRPFLFHNKASPIPNVLIMAQSLPVKYKTFLSCNFSQFDSQFVLGSLCVSASRNFKLNKSFEMTSAPCF